MCRVAKGDLWIKRKVGKGVTKRGVLVQVEGLTFVTWRNRKPVSFLVTVPTSETDFNLVQRSVKVNG